MSKRLVETVRCDVCQREREGCRVATIDFGGTVVVLDICPGCERKPFSEVFAAGASEPVGVQRGSSRKVHSVVPID